MVNRFRLPAVTKACISLYLLCVTNGGVASADVTSEFTSGDEGWAIVDLRFNIYQNPPVVLNTAAANWNASLGNPGGFISHMDGPDTPTQEWFWFSAPGAFLGNQLSAYGGTLSFDLQATTTDGLMYPDVILVGGGNSLFHLANPPTTSWTSRTITLDELSGWTSGDLVTPVTALQFQQTLGNLTRLYIDGDWRSGVETTGLDNVVLVPVPEPASLTFLALGLTWLALRRQRGGSA